jgi:hypothetical protein
MSELIKGTNIDFVITVYAVTASIVVILLGVVSCFFAGELHIDRGWHAGASCPAPVRSTTFAPPWRASPPGRDRRIGRTVERFIVGCSNPAEPAGCCSRSVNARRALQEERLEVLRVERRPRVGRSRQRAVLAVLAATMVGVYIAVRFEPRFGIGAAVALLHDDGGGDCCPCGLEFDLTTAAL